MDLQAWGLGHGSSAMDLEKMNIKFKTQKIWIQTQIGWNTKLKTIFKTSTPPKHQTQKSNSYFRPPNTKSKPKFSYFSRETKQKPQIQTLEPKPNHLQPQIWNYQIQTESTSDQPKWNQPQIRCFLLSRVCLGCGFERTRGKERQRGWDCVGFNEKERMKDEKGKCCSCI